MNDTRSLTARIRYIGQVIRAYPWIIGLCSLGILALYLFFDFREGGIGSNLGTTKMATASDYIKYFGAPWFYGMIITDIVLAVLTAISLGVAVAAFLARRSGTGATCSIGASALIGFAAFGCPGCPMPIAGSLGVTFFANTLPLFGFEFKVLTALILLGSLYWQTSPSRTASLRSGLAAEAAVSVAPTSGM
jgi:hypothetical protein